jgi:hypothetical protein
MIKLCDVLVAVSNTHSLVNILLTSRLHFYYAFMRLADVHNLDSQLTKRQMFAFETIAGFIQHAGGIRKLIEMRGPDSHRQRPAHQQVHGSGVYFAF